MNNIQEAVKTINVKREKTQFDPTLTTDDSGRNHIIEIDFSEGIICIILIIFLRSKSVCLSSTCHRIVKNPTIFCFKIRNLCFKLFTIGELCKQYYYVNFQNVRQ